MPRTITIELAVTADEFDRMTRKPTWLQRWHGAILRFVEKRFPWRKQLDFDRLISDD
jgi:hypothetical protein